MPRNYEMTPVPDQKRWIKQYKKKMYSVSYKQLNELYGPGIPETEVGTYQHANRWWQEKKAEVDAAGRPPERPLLPFEDVLRAQYREPAVFTDAGTVSPL